MRSLSDIHPNVSIEQILSRLVPPPQFVDATFANYLPNPQEPSQLAARESLIGFASRVNVGPRHASRRLFTRNQIAKSRPGVYLDGGFGVGKTHLLAALWHATESPAKSFGTFVEYTNMIGLLGFKESVKVFSTNRLVCIDEFELDDPGDTVLM